MNRVIKFRVWDIDERIFYTHAIMSTAGHLLRSCQPDAVDGSLDERGFVATTKYYPYDGVGYVIEQFTGLTDKNGKEIYEGDIIKAPIPSHPFGEQQYLLGAVRWGDKTGGFIIPGTIITGAPDTSVMEVIGNVHEHSELLSLCL